MPRKQLPLATSVVVAATLALSAGCGTDGGGSPAEDTKGGAAIGKGMARLPVEPTEEPTEEPTDDPATDRTDDPSDTPTGGSGLISADAKMGTCGWSTDGKPYANVKISNSSSSTAYYFLLVGFVDSSGEVVTTGTESDASVAGNSDKTIKVSGLQADSSKKAKKCRLSMATKSSSPG
ncbi:hypothetical protein [Streptomyces sp. Rer75]|uniref:hypothetical protein n=1 Tax=unclassified Streptomyces TaxID=2593676 RepID=UPI0015D0C51B|nr:hypothetical protein [Streptomyces sp. Rer75]QLH24661.1 hypothetical protein HYQ63_31765 [Streptomyces sp. Rer75]